MQNALYFRSQAAIYFELARRMSLSHDADVFRALGQEFIERAEQFEAGAHGAASPGSNPQGGVSPGVVQRG